MLTEPNRSRGSSSDELPITTGNDQGLKKRWVCVVVAIAFVWVNLYSPMLLRTILRAYQSSNSATAKPNTPRLLELSDEERRTLQRVTTKIYFSGMPQNAPNTTGAFIHVGKTGGSTLATVLRNGCHSFLDRPCQKVRNESIVSKTVTYYHTPDCDLLAQQPHDYYIWTVRDPFTRTVSAFLYQHPYNVYIRLKQYNEKVYAFPMRKLYPIFSRCFKTLNSFAKALKHQYQRNTNITLNAAQTLKCEVLASAMFQHKAERLSHHLHYDYRMFSQQLDEGNKQAVLVIRTEFLWHDWTVINELLGQTPGTVFSNETSQLRNTTKYALPVKPIIGDEERDYLCESIAPEYRVYFDLLSNAINLNREDVRKMKEIAKKNCPKLELPQDK
ncbi:unnamed protein product [Cylindrotheca closterium]|uniref:Sulfotransferase domain-containing protein n=1 Tax=Cylindrotheca closterium TaxID=2856 RepID=A0AAD2CSS7_9STRA|nr:unnamed protein product [Cylindrotheca closterium]